MIRKAKRHQNKVILFSSKHHVFPDRIFVEVVKQDDAIGVITHDKAMKRSWRQRIPLTLVSALIQIYYYDMLLLWSLIAKGVLFNGYDVDFSIDHIHTYPQHLSSQRVSASLIWKVDMGN